MRGSLFRSALRRDAQAARIVPSRGEAAWLTTLVSAAMAYLAVFALALSLAADRLAERWSGALAESATLRITAPVEQRSAQTQAALNILRQIPGVANARALTSDEQASLLAPWFGTGDLPDSLPMPQLIEISAGSPPYDRDGLMQRLRGELPGAILDDHSRWRRPLVQAADSLRLLAQVAMLLIVGTMVATIILAANASMAANAQVITVLRLIGARDGFIAQGFVRRFTWRGFSGAVFGTMLALLSVALLPDGSDSDTILTGLGFRGVNWLLPVLVPFLAATIAFFATLGAARRKLRGLI